MVSDNVGGGGSYQGGSCSGGPVRRALSKAVRAETN